MSKTNESTEVQKAQKTQEVQETQETQEIQEVKKVITADQNKIYVSASIKLGLKNYSTAQVDLGITQTVKEGDDIEKAAEELFDNVILNKVRNFASKLANTVHKMASIIKDRTIKEG